MSTRTKSSSSSKTFAVKSLYIPKPDEISKTRIVNKFKTHGISTLAYNFLRSLTERDVSRRVKNATFYKKAVVLAKFDERLEELRLQGAIGLQTPKKRSQLAQEVGPRTLQMKTKTATNLLPPTPLQTQIQSKSRKPIDSPQLDIPTTPTRTKPTNFLLTPRRSRSPSTDVEFVDVRMALSASVLKPSTSAIALDSDSKSNSNSSRFINPTPSTNTPTRIRQNPVTTFPLTPTSPTTTHSQKRSLSGSLVSQSRPARQSPVIISDSESDIDMKSDSKTLPVRLSNAFFNSDSTPPPSKRRRIGSISENASSISLCKKVVKPISPNISREVIDLT